MNTPPKSDPATLEPKSEGQPTLANSTSTEATAKRSRKSRRNKLLCALVAALILIVVVVAVVPAVILTRHKKSNTNISSSPSASPSPSGSSGDNGNSTSGDGGDGSDDSNYDPSITSGKTGSLIKMDNGAIFTYKNDFGGEWSEDPKKPFQGGGRAQAWSPSIGRNETWTWGKDIIRGVNLG